MHSATIYADSRQNTVGNVFGRNREVFIRGPFRGKNRLVIG